MCIRDSEYTEFEEYNKYYKTLTSTSLDYLKQDDGKSNDDGSYEAATVSDTAIQSADATSGTHRDDGKTAGDRAPDLADTQSPTTGGRSADVEIEDLGTD